MTTKLLLLTLVIYANFLFGQNIDLDVISSSSQNHTYQNIILEGTLGELNINSFELESVLISEGYHQPSLIVSNLNELGSLNFDINIFPNPTLNSFQVKLNGNTDETIFVMLLDNNGVVISKKQITLNDDEKILKFDNLVSGKYILTIESKKKQAFQSFKIIKI